MTEELKNYFLNEESEDSDFPITIDIMEMSPEEVNEVPEHDGW